jgi:F-type H+-transporting ATPase subunit epsilon
VGALDIGTVRVHGEDGTEEIIAVHGGFVEVSKDRVTVLSDVAEVASMIDIERARSAAERAENSLRSEQNVQAEAALRRARVRIEASTASVNAGR